LISFALVAYGSSKYIGSPGKMWDLLAEASAKNPISGNAQGSYLTMRSKSGLIFGVLNIVGNFGECMRRSHAVIQTWMWSLWVAANPADTP
jgi:Na+/proline symporter